MAPVIRNIDYYRVLQVPRTADEKLIKSSYRRLALLKHPDKNAEDPNATKNFQLLTEAYEILSDASTRQRFDARFTKARASASTNANQPKNQDPGVSAKPQPQRRSGFAYSESARNPYTGPNSRGAPSDGPSDAPNYVHNGADKSKDEPREARRKKVAELRGRRAFLQAEIGRTDRAIQQVRAEMTRLDIERRKESRERIRRAEFGNPESKKETQDRERRALDREAVQKINRERLEAAYATMASAESSLDAVSQKIEAEEENARREEETARRPGEGWGMPPPPRTSWSEVRLAEAQQLRSGRNFRRVEDWREVKARAEELGRARTAREQPPPAPSPSAEELEVESRRRAAEGFERMKEQLQARSTQRRQ